MRNFSVKDEKFWQEYSKMKTKGGRYPTLDSQEILYNKTQPWKYSEKVSLDSEEFLDCINTIKKDEDIPFIILDVRESHELEIFELPKKNKVKIYYAKNFLCLEWC